MAVDASLDRWGLGNVPLVPANAPDQPEPQSYVIPICMRGAEGRGRCITINGVAVAILANAVALKIANIFLWKSNLISVLSDLAIGASVATLIKMNWLGPGERVLDEFSMFLAPFLFQVITQAEINTSPSL